MSSRYSNRSTSSVVSPRPRAGGRYNTNNRVTCSAVNSAQWGKIIYPGGPKLWRRLVIAFTIMALFGVIFLILGAVFLENARKIQEESGISLPVIWCIIGMVCGSLMIMCSIFLGKKMVSSKWRTNGQPGYNRANANNSQNNSDSYRETFVASSRSRSDTIQSSDADQDLPPPYESNASRNQQQALPPAAVFIISRGDVNLAIPAVLQNNLAPPKYNISGLVEPPTYSESDPMRPPKYEETFQIAEEIDVSDGETSVMPDVVTNGQRHSTHGDIVRETNVISHTQNDDVMSEVPHNILVQPAPESQENIPEGSTSTSILRRLPENEGAEIQGISDVT